jgi:hypothetical protein
VSREPPLQAAVSPTAARAVSATAMRPRRTENQDLLDDLRDMEVAFPAARPRRTLLPGRK